MTKKKKYIIFFLMSQKKNNIYYIFFEKNILYFFWWRKKKPLFFFSHQKTNATCFVFFVIKKLDHWYYTVNWAKPFRLPLPTPHHPWFSVITQSPSTVNWKNKTRRTQTHKKKERNEFFGSFRWTLVFPRNVTHSNHVFVTEKQSGFWLWHCPHFCDVFLFLPMIV